VVVRNMVTGGTVTMALIVSVSKLRSKKPEMSLWFEELKVML
jgi:hypothetical protein